MTLSQEDDYVVTEGTLLSLHCLGQPHGFRASSPPEFCQLDEIDFRPNPLEPVFHRDDQWFDQLAEATITLLASCSV